MTSRKKVMAKVYVFFEWPSYLLQNTYKSEINLAKVACSCCVSIYQRKLKAEYMVYLCRSSLYWGV